MKCAMACVVAYFFLVAPGLAKDSPPVLVAQPQTKYQCNNEKAHEESKVCTREMRECMAQANADAGGDYRARERMKGVCVQLQRACYRDARVFNNCDPGPWK